MCLEIHIRFLIIIVCIILTVRVLKENASNTAIGTTYIGLANRADF